MARKFIFGGSYASFAYLLSLYPNATLGFSLRKLRSDYTGSCVRVRRSSDDSTLDIGFVNNAIDTATLLTFVGSGSGYVTIWYNQATSNNATQTVLANQPRIVNNGVFETKNGKPSIYFSGNQWFDITTISEVFSTSIVVGSKDNAIVRFTLFGTDVTTTSVTLINIANLWYLQRSSGYIVTNATDIFIDQGLMFGVKSASATQLYKNGSFITSNFVNFSINNQFNKIARYTSTNPSFTVGHIQEIAYYPQDETSNRLGIETNINEYYGIY